MDTNAHPEYTPTNAPYMYGPTGQNYPPTPAPKGGLSGWKLWAALFAAWLVGVLSMIAFAFAVPVDDDPLTPEEREKLEKVQEAFNHDDQ